MKLDALALALIVAMGPVVSTAQEVEAPAAPAASSKPDQWAAWGGTVGVRWFELLGDAGVTIKSPTQRLAANAARLTDGGVGIRQALDVELFELRRSGSIEFRTQDRSFAGFTGGSLQARGGYVLELVDGSSIDLTDFRLRPAASDPLRLEVVSSDGKAWFYIDRLMYDIEGGGRVLAVYTADMRMSRALAERIGHAYLADQPVADLEILTEVVGDGLHSGNHLMADPVPSHWHGDPVPGQPAGTIYQADLFMQNISISRMRQTGATGHEGTGRVVFAPSSTLKNNNNNGSAVVTVPGQGALGTSAALWTADIPWRAKFSGIRKPYDNDQHPFLIWNMYRVNADGSIEQIGRSPVKHAWLTTNGSCAPGENHDGAILGRSCTDTYSTGNNDANQDLSLRSEIIPATNQWGRCGSLFDPGCVGSNTNSSPTPNDGYERRLVVNEAQISNTKNVGASFYFDSWYLAREDVNIYNSMATVTGTPTWSGTQWSFASQANFRLGSITDRWVELAQPANTVSSNTELAVAEGHTKVAVRVTDLGNGQWRYHYAVHNLDFSRAQTQGAEPNLRVTSNKGFNRFSVPLPEGVNVLNDRFSDGDLEAGNDWSFSSAGNALSWDAPAGGSLDWGTLYLFSVTLDAAPVTGTSALNVATAGTPASFEVETLVAEAPLVDLIFKDGFEPSTP